METVTTSRELFAVHPESGVTPTQLATTAKHVAAIASTDSARGVLAGVLVESDDNGIKLTATDSYRLIHAVIPMSYVPAFDPVVLEAKTLAKLPAFVKGWPCIGLTYTPGAIAAMFTRGDGGTFPVPVLTGTFADYRRLIPAESAYSWPATGETVAYNPVLLAGLLDSFAGILGKQTAYRGSEYVPVRVVNVAALKLTTIRGMADSGIDVTGLIMPCRS